jgi:hypothetical protein
MPTRGIKAKIRKNDANSRRITANKDFILNGFSRSDKANETIAEHPNTIAALVWLMFSRNLASIITNRVR